MQVKLRQITKIATLLSLLLIGCSKGANMVTNNMKDIPDNTQFYNQDLGVRSLLPIGKSRVHFRPSAGWLGDAHPVYKDGLWYLYYLDLPFDTPNRGTLSGVKQGLAVSNDLVNWNVREPKIDNVNRPWWAIANTFNDGIMYSMFNDVVTNSGYGLAKSSDLLNFNDFGVVYPYSYILGDEPRDPTIFYDEKTDIFYFIHAVKNYANVYDRAQGELYYSTTKDFSIFSELKLLYRPDNANITECPELFKIGSKYYLVMNWGTDRVGGARYRVSNSPTGPWTAPLIDTFQSTEFMAPNSSSDGNRRISFGWIPTYQNNEDGKNFQWGGDLAFPIQLSPRKDASLKSNLAIDPTLIQGDKIYEYNPSGYDYVKGDGWHSSTTGFVYENTKSYGEIWLDNNFPYFDFSAKITLGNDSRGAGLVFRTGNRGFDGYEVFIDPITNQIIFRYHFERRSEIASVPAKIKAGETMNFRVIVDGPIIEIYLNDEYALSCRAHIPTTRNAIGLFTEYGGAKFEEIEVFDLKKIY